MRILSKFSFLLLGAALSAGMASAQAPESSAPQTQAPSAEGGMHHHHGMNADREVKFLTRKLNLTADQAAQVKPILADRDEKMKALHADTSIAPDQKHVQRKSINDDAQAKMAGILNDTQKQQLAEMKSERRQHWGHRGQGQQAAPAAAPTA
jgi:protein CpxP